MTAEKPIVIEEDGYLEGYSAQIKARIQRLKRVEKLINENFQSLENFTKCYFGYDHNNKVFREYVPGAKKVFLIGDFNNWNRESHQMKNIGNGEFEIQNIQFSNGMKYKIFIENQSQFDRLSPYSRRVEQQKDSSFCSVYYKEDYEKLQKAIPIPDKLKIYEAHVGIASQEPKVASYKHFTQFMIPRIKKLGYNVIQLMAIQEHAYYASFGYQVTSFFAPSSRFGTSTDLKELIQEAHNNNICVFLDLVHSHASKNVLDGLNMLDGTDYCYFHAGERGTHPMWDSKVFNYGSIATLRFLLSNVRYWIDFGFDGFRFDGVTSMLYRHHGSNFCFTGNYNEYFQDDGGNQNLAPSPVFGEAVDSDAVMYLMLANKLLHSHNCISIAEDVSGMPTLARPVDFGGVGFDYRLSMAVPDMWIAMIKQEQHLWSMKHVVFTLTNHRFWEKVVCYCESHDQALVGDKTLAFWLMDSEMYTNMSIFTPSLIVDRGIALHKMIRWITFVLGGDSYLNFMGNEFGHPEWLDFPREGNGNSHHYARRQWNLALDSNLKYKFLELFDVEMLKFDFKQHFIQTFDQIIFAESTNCFVIFNFSQTSYPDFEVPAVGKFKIILDTDDSKYGGFDRINRQMVYEGEKILIYSPSQSAQMYSRI